MILRMFFFSSCKYNEKEQYDLGNIKFDKHCITNVLFIHVFISEHIIR